ncbi:MAG TPA: DUF305 domain-containing protein [Candidatus Saccharimonadales bacterium]
METKSLLYGLLGFFLGGLLVATAASLEKSSTEPTDKKEVSMSQITAALKDKKGDDYDRTFITHMIDHHQAAVDMAKLSGERAEHQEIKDLSKAIVDAQEEEIAKMQQWKKDWYNTTQPAEHTMH